ncbi:MAG: tetratricopeptide repeat protein [Treponema sp.]
MQHNKKIVKLFLACSFLVFSCVSTPKVQEIEQEIIEDVQQPTEKKMGKHDFGLLLQSFLVNGDYESALALFEKTEDLDKSVLEDVSTKILHLSILISANKISKAKAMVSQLEEEYPNNVEVLYCRVMIAQSQNDDKTKSEYLKKILTRFPHDSWALTEQGLDLYTKKNYKGAKLKFLAALKNSPKNVEALLGLARVNYMQNRLKDAESNLNLVLEVNKDNSIALAELARIKSETNRILQAVEDMKKATELDKDIPSHWLDLGIYTMQIGKKDEAKEAFTNVIKLDPSSYMAYIYRAGINDELGFSKEALEDYNKIISLYPAYYFAFEGAGILYTQNQEWDKAAVCFKNVLKRAVDHYQYAILSSFCLYKAGKEKEAKELMREYLKVMDKTTKEDEYFLARLFLENSGDSDVNNRIAKVKEKTTYYKMMFYLGAYYELKGKNLLAEKCYLEVLSAKVPSFIEYRLTQMGMDRLKQKS